MAHLYNEETISQAIDTKWAGKTVHFAREIDSTNLWGKRAWRAFSLSSLLILSQYFLSR